VSRPKTYRAVANGNVLPAEHVPQGLIDAGIYVPVDEEAEAAAKAKAAEPITEVEFRPAAALESALVQPEAEVLTTAHLPAQPARARKGARKRRG
jgi:hypothetical protein